MPDSAFDTRPYVRKLRDAGVPEAQAEIQLEAIVTILEHQLAPERDLELRKVELERQIAELKRDVKQLDVKLETQIA